MRNLLLLILLVSPISFAQAEPSLWLLPTSDGGAAVKDLALDAGVSERSLVEMLISARINLTEFHHVVLVEVPPPVGHYWQKQ
jgi:hypothetical protein